MDYALVMLQLLNEKYFKKILPARRNNCRNYSHQLLLKQIKLPPMYVSWDLLTD